MIWTVPRLVSMFTSIAARFSRQKNGGLPGNSTARRKVELVATQNRIAVVLIVSSHGGMKMAVPPKLLGDHFSLIRAGGTSSPEIELLQRDNID